MVLNRILCSLLLVLIVRTAFSEIYFLRLNDGFLRVITSENIELHDAITVSNNTFQFYGDVSFQFVTDNLSNDQRIHENILSSWLFGYYNRCYDLEDFHSSFFLFGSGSQAENNFFTMVNPNADSKIISEEHCSDQYQSSESMHQSGHVAEVSSASSSSFPCLFDCSRVFRSYSARCKHRTRDHKNEYSKLNGKCEKGFICPYCNYYITSLQMLTRHLSQYHPEKKYDDFY